MRHNLLVMAATWDEFERLELTVGRIVEVEHLAGTRKPFYAMTVDFGSKGTRRSAAQITHYSQAELMGRQVVCVLGFDPKSVAGFESEVLVLGAMSESKAVVLLRPDEDVEEGTPIA